MPGTKLIDVDEVVVFERQILLEFKVDDNPESVVRKPLKIYLTHYIP